MAVSTTRIIEQCRVAPSPGAPAQLVLKLLHFDMLYLSYNPIKHIIFYKFKCSESHFSNTIVPALKTSLSLTLNHFLPIAGKILIPGPTNSDDNRMPVFHYAAGDEDEDSSSVPLTIAINSTSDHFESLTAFHAKETRDLHDLVPDNLPPPSPSPDGSSTLQFPVVAAFQATLFPDKGVCIGITAHHSIGDVATLLGFLRVWSCINRSNGDGSPELLECQLPSIDRDSVPDGDRLAVEFWKALKMFPSLKTVSSLPIPSRVLATFVLSEEGVKALKSRAAFPDGVRMSSFSLASAYLWTCLARAAAAAGEEVADDEAEYLICGADCRRLLNPPLPSNYFGNCLALILVELSHGKLRGEGGFSAAAEAVGGAIRKVVEGESEKGIMDVSYEAIMETARVVGKRTVVISGSTKLDFYATDFGWGKPVKFEALRDNNPGSVVYIGKSREHRRGMEISLLMPKPQMDAFARFFGEGLPTAEKICSKM